MKNENHSRVKIIPLGGLEAIGMNMTIIEFEDSIIVVDCGMSFPSDDMLGIDLVIPDITYLKENVDKVKQGLEFPPYIRYLPDFKKFWEEVDLKTVFLYGNDMDVSGHGGQ